MAAYTTIELDRIAPDPGDGKRIEVDLDPGTVRLGADEYAFEPAPAKVRLDVSRTAAGHALKLAFAGELAGPCMRCLGPARVRGGGRGAGGRSAAHRRRGAAEPVRDRGRARPERLGPRRAGALRCPSSCSAAPDCAGLCPVCGETLNDAAPGAHEHPWEPDPRWAKLRELKLD